MKKQKILNHYIEKQDEIESRIEDFKALRKAGDERLFQELSFVIFSSQSSAENSWNACKELRAKGLLEKDREKISEVLSRNEIQYEERKAEYIVKNRKFLSQPTFENPSTELKLKSWIKPGNLEKTRKWIAENIKGLSWKGSSHFLRNIGYGDNFAILSQHTVSVLFDLDVLKIAEPPKNETEYLEAEKKVQKFSEEIEIEMEALDLTMWSYKTSNVFK